MFQVDIQKLCFSYVLLYLLHLIYGTIIFDLKTPSRFMAFIDLLPTELLCVTITFVMNMCSHLMKIIDL